MFNEHREKFGKFPTSHELLISSPDDEVFSTIKDILDFKTDGIYSDEFMEDVAAEYFREKMLFTNVFEVIESVKKDGTKSVGDFPDKIREALSFSFDTKNWARFKGRY